MAGDRLKALRSALKDAQRALRALDAEQRRQQLGEMQRLEAGLAYAEVVIARTDDSLLSSASHQELTGLVGEIANNPQLAAADPASFHARLMAGTAQVPVAQAKDFEQSAKDAASTFNRSIAQRQRRLEGELTNLREDAQTARSEVNASHVSATDAVAAAQTEFDERLKVIEGESEQAVKRITDLHTQHTEAFEEEQARRDEADNERWETNRVGLMRKAEGLTGDVQRIRDEVEGIAGAVGEAVSANHYGDVAKRERFAYFGLMAVTVLALGAAVYIASKAAHSAQLDAEHFIPKFSVSLVLAALAAFTGNSARDHRNEEKRASDQEAQLRVFGPFIEPLGAHNKERERVIMARRTFGRQNGASPDEPGLDDIVEAEEEAA